MGRPKAWLPFEGELLLPRVVRVLGEIVSPVVVVAADGQDLPPLPAGVWVVRDERPDRGPLQGMAAGLRAVGTEIAFVSACDVPLLRPDFVRLLIDRLEDFDAAVPHAGGRPHPLSAAYHVEPTLAAVDAALSTHILAVRTMLDRLRVRRLEQAELRAADPALDSLRNANTPAEYEAFRNPA
jgi:molybdopterin-guanine dinucleotide biosynthesis protein A